MIKVWNSFYNRHRKPIVIIMGVTMAVATALILRPCVRSGRVNGDSMYPTLMDGDLFFFREESGAEKGDIIVFIPPEEAVMDGEDGSTFIKRVIATEGDHVKIEGSTLYINGKEVKEPYIEESYSADIDMTVPKGQLFVLGDNRNISRDSRHYGTIDKDTVLGAVYKFCLRK